MTEIKDLEILTGDNDDNAPPLGAPEEMDRSDTNDTLREMMGKIARDWRGSSSPGVKVVGGGMWRDPSEGNTVSFASSSSMTVAGIDVRIEFPVGRKVKITYASGNPGYAFVTSSTFSTNTTVNVDDFDGDSPDNVVRNATINRLEFSSAMGDSSDGGIGKLAYDDEGEAFVIPDSFTGASINAALAVANASNKIVLLLAGQYVLEESITMLDGTSLWGMGRGSTLLTISGGANLSMIIMPSGVGGFEIKGMTLDGQAATASGVGIFGGDAHTDILIADIEIKNTYAGGILIASSTVNSQSLTIRNVQLFNTGSDAIKYAEAAEATSSENISIEDCYVKTIGEGGLANVLSDAFNIDGYGAIIRNCTYVIDTSTSVVAGTGFQINGTKAQISNCVVEVLTPEFQTEGINAVGDGVMVSNCDVSIGTVLKAGIRVGDFALVTGCSVDAGNTGIHIDDDSVCTGNRVSNSGQNGIANFGDRSVITDNHIYDPATDGIQSYGDDVVIKGNTIHNPAVDGIVLGATSTGTIAIDNIVNDPGSGSAIESSGATSPLGLGEVFIPGVEQLNVGVSEVVVTGMEGVDWPLPANGSRKFLVSIPLALDWSDSDITVLINIRVGTSGDITDAIVGSLSDSTQKNSMGPFQWFVGPIAYVPAAGTFITVTVTSSDSPDVLANMYNEEGFIAHTYLSIKHLSE